MFFYSSTIEPHVVPASYLTALCESLNVEEVEKFLKNKLDLALLVREKNQPGLPHTPKSLEEKPLLLLDNYQNNPFVFGFSYILYMQKQKEQKELSLEEKEKITRIYKLLVDYLEPKAPNSLFNYTLNAQNSFFPLNLVERAYLEMNSDSDLDFFERLLSLYGVKCSENFFEKIVLTQVCFANRSYVPIEAPQQNERALQRVYERFPHSVYAQMDSTVYQHLIIKMLDKKASNPYAAVVSPAEEQVVLKLIKLFLSKGLKINALEEPQESFFSTMPYNRTRFMAVLGLKTENVDIVKLLACHTEFDSHKTKAEISRLLQQAHQAYKSSGAQFLMGLTPEEIEKYQLELNVSLALQIPTKDKNETKTFKI